MAAPWTWRWQAPGHGPRHQRATLGGFTLIEVLVAVSVMAIMALMAWRGVEGIVRTQQAAQDRLAQTYTLNTALSQWAADLQAVQETPWAPALSFDGNTLRLTRETADGLQIVAWTLGADGLWRRWSAPPTTRRGDLQEWWMRSMTLARTLDDPRVQTTEALRGVAQWQVYYFRDNAWTNPQSSDARALDDPPEAPGESVDPPADGSAAPAPPISLRTGRVNNPARGVRLGGARQASTLPEGVRLVLSLGPDGSGSLTGLVTRDLVLRRGDTR